MWKKEAQRQERQEEIAGTAGEPLAQIMPDTDQYMTPIEAAQHHQVTLRTIYKAMEQKTLTPVEVLGKTVLSRVQVLAWQPRKYGTRARRALLPAFAIVWPGGDLTLVRVAEEAKARSWAFAVARDRCPDWLDEAGELPFDSGFRVIPLSERTMTELKDAPTVILGQNPVVIVPGTKG